MLWLIETIVVFESMLCKYYRRKHERLIETIVVFELSNKKIADIESFGLIETIVVFESIRNVFRQPVF